MSENQNIGQIMRLDIRKKRKSMISKKNLIDQAEYQNSNLTKETNNKRKSINLGSFSNIGLTNKKEETKDSELVNSIKKRKSRKSFALRSSISLNKFLALKGQLISASELLVNQQPDISEILCGCQQPNNYHVYLRESNGHLSYLYKLREYSGKCNRLFCPVSCREFTMKMKLMSDSSNKYDTDFSDSLMTLQRNFKCPCLCIVRPDIIIDLTKEKTRVGRIIQNFSFCDPCFTVFNENDEDIYYIEADCCQCGFICRNNSLGKTDDCQFFIYNSNERSNPIGVKTKKTESIFSLADNYHVVFPPKIAPEEKFLLSIVSVLIDYHYFENNNEVNR